MKNPVFKFSNLSAALFLFAVIFGLHADILLKPLSYYFSAFDLKDLNYFINIRLYAAKCLLSGIFPLWIPELFCGHPFFANYETAVLNPLNLIFLVLPVCKAVNISFFLHFFIFSFSVYLWINGKIRDNLVSLMTAVISVFGSCFYLHACAGHLSNITTMAWAPLLLYFYDRTFVKNSYINIIPVSVVVSLQIFAGHFQYVYYTALVSLVYILLFCRSRKTLIVFFVSYLISVFLCAVQLLPSLDFYLKGARHTGGVFQNINFKYGFADILSLICPPSYENIKTINYFWESVFYIGTYNIFIIITAAFACFGREKLKAAAVILILYILSLKYTSDIAESVIPFFGLFRSPVKLNFFMMMFFMLLLAYSVRDIFSAEKNKIKAVLFIYFISCISLFFNEEASVLTEIISAASFVILMMLSKYRPAKILIIAVAVIQPVFFSRILSQPFLFRDFYEYKQMFVKNQNDDFRFLANSEYYLKYNYENSFGSAPDILNRYNSFVKILETNTDHANIFSVLRNKYVVNAWRQITDCGVPLLKRINVFYKYKVENNPGTVAEILTDTENRFDVFGSVILDREPYEPVSAEGEYTVENLKLSCNYIEADIATTEPAVILFTDNYESGWKASDKNTKQKYEIIPAYGTFKAICVGRGNHKIRLEYKPLPFTAGLAVSLLSWILFLTAAAVVYFRRRKTVRTI